ncbi:MAG: GvpL/GvpF family gas vesicle protein [Pseudomonadota bacterium]
MILILHGFLRSAQSREWPATLMDAVERDPAVIVQRGAVAAVLTASADDTVFSDPARVESIALGHNRLLTILAEAVDVAPVRLGAVYGSRKAAETMLSQSEAAILARLDAVTGAVEYSAVLRALQTPASPKPAPSAPTATPGEAGSGRAYLRAKGQRKRQVRDRKAAIETALERVAERLAPSARRLKAVTQPKLGPDGPLCEFAILQDRTLPDAFLEAIADAKSLAEAAGLQLTVSGPWPPYAFVEEADAA